MILESGEMSKQVMSWLWALYVLMHAFWRRSHILTFVSTAPDTTTLLSCPTYRAEQLVKCPFNFDIAKEYMYQYDCNAYLLLLVLESQLIMEPPCVPSSTFLLYAPWNFIAVTSLFKLVNVWIGSAFSKSKTYEDGSLVPHVTLK